MALCQCCSQDLQTTQIQLHWCSMYLKQQAKHVIIMPEKLDQGQSQYTRFRLVTDKEQINLSSFNSESPCTFFKLMNSIYIVSRETGLITIQFSSSLFISLGKLRCSIWASKTINPTQPKPTHKPHLKSITLTIVLLHITPNSKTVQLRGDTWIANPMGLT